MTGAPSLAISEVTISYDGATAVAGVSFDVDRGAWVTLIGPNGAGKSTLLRAVAGLVDYEGEIVIEGTPTSALGRNGVARRVAYVPQRPFLPSPMTVAEYVLMGRTPYISYFGSESRHDLAVAGDALDLFDLQDLATRGLGSLSGGEAQRAVLARAFAQEAPILLLDEPTAALDIGHQQQVLELVDRLRAAKGLTVVSAMHDLTMTSEFADRLLLLDGGAAVASGPPAEVLTEATIAKHYGASARVMRGDDGEVFVIPTRSGAKGRS